MEAGRALFFEVVVVVVEGRDKGSMDEEESCNADVRPVTGGRIVEAVEG